MNEYQVPIMFDVSAVSREAAAQALVEVLARMMIPGCTVRDSSDDAAPMAMVESWWTIEAGDKQYDRNDNDAGRVVFDEAVVQDGCAFCRAGFHLIVGSAHCECCGGAP